MNGKCRTRPAARSLGSLAACQHGQGREEAIGTDTPQAVADRGYFNGEEFKTCADAGITVTLPKPTTSSAKADGRFGKEDFVYTRSAP
jgi:hypothetical protein